MIKHLLRSILVVLLSASIAGAATGTWTTNNFAYKPKLTTQGTVDRANFDTGQDRIDAKLAATKALGDPGYETLSDALTTIGATETDLGIPAGKGSIALTGNTVIPANIRLIVGDGTYFTLGDYNLTINGPVEAGAYQIFALTGTGDVDFADGVEVKSSWFADFATAIGAVDSDKVKLLVTGDATVGANLSTDPNTTLKFLPGNIITVSDTYTLTLYGPVEADRYQIFALSGTGTVAFSSDSPVNAVYPEWWGATTAAFQSAVDSGRPVDLCQGKTYTVGQIEIPSGLLLNGNFATISRNTTETPGHTTWNDNGNIGTYLFVPSEAITSLVIKQLKVDNHHSDSATLYRGFFGVIGYNISDALFQEIESLDCHSIFVKLDERTANRVTIDRCKMVGVNAYASGATQSDGDDHSVGIAMFNDNTYDCVIQNCYADKVSWLAIINTDDPGSQALNARNKMINNYVSNTGDTAIYYYGDYGTIAGNTVYYAGKDGIKINSAYTAGSDDSEYCVISNNIVHGAGLFVSTGGNCIVSAGKHHVITGNILHHIDPALLDATSTHGMTLIGEYQVISDNQFYADAISGAYPQGIACNETVYSGTTGNFIISNNNFYGYCRMMTAAGTVTNVTFTGNNGYNLENYGVRLSRPTDSAPFRPIWWTISNNIFHGGAASCHLISLRYVDRVTISGNQFRGTRDYDIYSTTSWWGGNFGAGNISDGEAVTSNAIPSGQPFTGAPSYGTWRVGEIAVQTSGVRQICTANGTFSSATDSTGDTDGSTAVITGLTDTADFEVGHYVSVTAGFPSTGPYLIIAKTATTMTLNVASNSAQSDITVSTPDPTFTADAVE